MIIQTKKKRLFSLKNKGKTFILLAIMGLSCVSASKGISESIAEESIKGKDLLAMGRSRVTSKGLELITSGSYFSFEFSGKDFQLKVALPNWVERSYIQYEIDGVYQQRVKIEKGGATLSLSASTDGKHIVTIYKATEAQSGGVFIEEVIAKNAKPVAVAKGPLIEFIGDSITCGAASDVTDVPCGKGAYTDYHNAYLAYGPRVARALKANFIVSGASGKGVYRNWNNDGPGVPVLYRTKSMMPNDKDEWDFKTFRPNIISIALGTNDLSDGDKKTERLPFDKEKFVTEYIKFIDALKEANPDAKIVLLNSPTVNGAKKQLLEEAMLAIKTAVDQKYSKAKPVTLLYFTAIKPKGCNGHPNTEDHEQMANEITAQFKNILNQK